IYALGCVLYEMIAGTPPFTGPSAPALLVRHLTDPAPSIRTARPDVPESVDRVLATALAKDPSQRFSSAAEMAASLEAPHAVSIAAPARSPARAPGARDKFVAVLPFRNMSAAPENEYFSDGVTEDIIAQLSKIRGLGVVSRTSTMRFKERPPSVRDIGRDLGVSHVLDGSVRRDGARLRIVAQLVDAHTDEQLWAETYDRQMTDVFAIQSEVAERIAETLQARLSPTDRSRIMKKPTDDLEAYNLYLLGRHHYNKVTPDDFSRALDYYRRAIDRDPMFARAYASLAEAQIYLGLGYWGLRPHDSLPEAFAHATRGLMIDPDSAAAHASAGVYHEWYEYNWDKAGAEFEQAVSLNPSSSWVRICRAIHLCALGDFDEASTERDLACQLDPSAMSVRGNATWILYLSGRRDEAVAEGRRLREIEPSSAYGAFSHGLVCAQGGEPREAVAAFRDAVGLSDGMSLYLVMLAYGLAVAGERDEAQSLLDDLDRRAHRAFVWPMGLAMAHAHLGHEDTALVLLERAYEERVGWMPLVGREPAFHILRSSSRFRRLLAEIGPPHALADLCAPAAS